MTTTRVYRGGSKPTGLRSDTLGEKLRHYRLQRGLSQQELADGICSTPLISAIERGTTNPRIPTIEKLAERLQVPLSELYRPGDDADFPNAVKLELVQAYLKRNEFEAAQGLLDLLDKRDDVIEVERQTMTLLQAEVWNKTGKAKEAVELLQPVVDEVEGRGAEGELAVRLYNQLGTGFFKRRQFAKAYSAYKRGYQISLRLPAFEMVAANVTYNLGIVCNQLELWDEAEMCLERAREYYESVADMKSVADSYFELAIATKTESFVSRALMLYETLESFKMLNTVRQYYAYHIESKKDYAKAAVELNQIAQDFERGGELGKAVFVATRACMICLDHSDTESAKRYLGNATEYIRNIPNETPYETALYYRARARISLALNDFDSCLQDALRSSELYDTMDMYSESADSLDYVVEAYQKMGRHEEAVEAAKKTNALLRRSRRTDH